MTGLFKNELIKTFKTGFVKAALCVILAFSILYPAGCYFLNSSVGEYEPTYFTDLAENEDSVEGKAYYNALGETDKFFYENKIASGDDWRYNEYYSSYQTLVMAKTVCSLAKSGSQKNITENFFSYEEMNCEVNFDKDTLSAYYTEENYKDVFTLKPEELDKKIAELDGMIQELEAGILNAKIEDFYKMRLDMSAEELAESQNSLQAAEAELAKSPDNAKIKMTAEEARAAVKTAELNQWGMEYLNKNKPEYDSWQYNSVMDILTNAAAEFSYNVLMNEELFSTSDERHMFKSYDEYKAKIEALAKDAEEAVELVKYSLDKNIPLPEAYVNSLRSSFLSDAGSAAFIVCLFMVAVASTIMFNEYSTGSVRLLLIRPKSRSKILLSKLLTVIFYGVVTMLVSLAVLFVMELIFTDNNDMTVPYLLMKGGKVAQINPIVYTLMNVGARMFSAFVIIAFAFMLSAVFAKGGIFALTVGAAALCVSSLTQPICAELNSRLRGVLTYTVLPYLNLSQYIGNTVKEYSYGGSTMLGEIFGGNDAQFDPAIGTVIVAAHIALFLAIAFGVFKKKQIKN